MRAKKLDHEYGPIGGIPEFCKHSIKLALGDDSQHVANGQVCFNCAVC